MFQDLLQAVDALPEKKRQDFADIVYLRYGTCDFDEDRINALISQLRGDYPTFTLADNEGVTHGNISRESATGDSASETLAQEANQR